MHKNWVNIWVSFIQVIANYLRPNTVFTFLSDVLFFEINYSIMCLEGLKKIQLVSRIIIANDVYFVSMTWNSARNSHKFEVRFVIDFFLQHTELRFLINGNHKQVKFN